MAKRARISVEEEAAAIAPARPTLSESDKIFVQENYFKMPLGQIVEKVGKGQAAVEDYVNSEAFDREVRKSNARKKMAVHKSNDGKPIATMMTKDASELVDESRKGLKPKEERKRKTFGVYKIRENEGTV